MTYDKNLHRLDAYQILDTLKSYSILSILTKYDKSTPLHIYFAQDSKAKNLSLIPAIIIQLHSFGYNGVATIGNLSFDFQDTRSVISEFDKFLKDTIDISKINISHEDGSNSVNILITDDLNPTLPKDFKYDTIYLSTFKGEKTILNSPLYKNSKSFRRV